MLFIPAFALGVLAGFALAAYAIASPCAPDTSPKPDSNTVANVTWTW